MQIKVFSSEILVRLLKNIKKSYFDPFNPSATPIKKGMKTKPENLINDTPLSKPEPYSGTIDSFLYLAIISRPHISYAVN